MLSGGVRGRRFEKEKRRDTEISKKKNVTGKKKKKKWGGAKKKVSCLSPGRSILGEKLDEGKHDR